MYKLGTIFSAHLIISSNINRFLIFSHCWNQQTICNKTITIDLATPQVCCYTTLWNVSVLEVTIENKIYFKKLSTETTSYCSSSHVSQFLHQMFNLSTLLLDDTSNTMTPLTNSVINHTLRQFAPLSDDCLFSWLTVMNCQHW